MASKEVVSARARVQIQHVLQELAEERGNLRLAMLVPTELPDHWSLLVSASWMDSLGPRSVISDLTSRLLRHVDKNFLSAIDNVSVMLGSDPFVKTFTETLHGFLGVDPTAHRGGFAVHAMKIEGRDIPQGFVFVADPRANGKPAKSASVSHKVSAR